MKKLEKLAALVSLQAALITEAQLQEVNQELSENEFNLEVTTTGTVDSFKTQISQLEKEKNTATETVANHEATIQELNLKIKTLEDDAKKAGADTTDPKTSEDVITPGKTDSSAHETLSAKIRSEFNL